jgi:hypothetical protein
LVCPLEICQSIIFFTHSQEKPCINLEVDPDI